MHTRFQLLILVETLCARWRLVGGFEDLYFLSRRQIQFDLIFFNFNIVGRNGSVSLLLRFASSFIQRVLFALRKK